MGIGLLGLWFYSHATYYERHTMATYRVSYYEEESGFIYFDAKNLTEAEALVEQVQNGEIDDTDLPKMVKKSRNGQLDYDYVEEVK